MHGNANPGFCYTPVDWWRWRHIFLLNVSLFWLEPPQFSGLCIQNMNQNPNTNVNLTKPHQIPHQIPHRNLDISRILPISSPPRRTKFLQCPGQPGRCDAAFPQPILQLLTRPAQCQVSHIRRMHQEIWRKSST